MNVENLSHNVSRLDSIFLNILYLKSEDRLISPNSRVLDDLKDVLNAIFEDNVCDNVLYTLNTDKEFFGIKVYPKIFKQDVVKLLNTEEPIAFVHYSIEFDSKLFGLGLNGIELAAITLHDISSVMDSPELIDHIRALVDSKEENDIISLRDSINYFQLITFAIKDTMNKFSSIVYKDIDEIDSNPAIQAADLVEDVESAKDKIVNNTGMGDTTKESATTIFNWMVAMCRNFTLNSRLINDTLKDAKSFTGSKLDADEIDKTIYALSRIDSAYVNTIVEEKVALDKFFNKNNIGSLNEISLFKNLKKNGLRGLENEVYEFSIKVKNCNTAEDAFYIMRGINSRINILEDYIANDPSISEAEKEHWEMVLQQYMNLRVALSQKKFKEKKWNLFIDYNKLDELDNKETELF